MKCFKKILVPVDFSINTSVAVRKAMEFATPNVTEIHLLHVNHHKRFIGIKGIAGSISSSKNIDTGIVMNNLSQQILNEYPEINAIIRVVSGKDVQESIITESKRINADLIVIGKKNHHSFFPFLNTVVSANIADTTDCPVLTVKPGSLNKKIETVVMPVCNSYPNKKMDLLLTLNSKAILNIHLITILNKDQTPDNHSVSALLQSIKSIRNKIKCNVQHCTIHANNKAVATLRYAEKVNANILLVSTQTETHIPTWISKKEITDFVNPASQLQIISVQAH